MVIYGKSRVKSIALILSWKYHYELKLCSILQKKIFPSFAYEKVLETKPNKSEVISSH